MQRLVLVGIVGLVGCASVLNTVRPPRTGQFAMPDLSGKTKGEVETALAVVGKSGSLDVKMTDCGDEAVREGTVCQQSPEAGQTTQAAGPTLVYIQEKRNPKMPDVLGMEPEAGKRLVRDAGFASVEIRTLSRPRPGCKVGRICVTSPEPGVRAHAHLEKVLWVQPKAAEPSTTTDVEPEPRADADQPADPPVPEPAPEPIF